MEEFGGGRREGGVVEVVEGGRCGGGVKGWLVGGVGGGREEFFWIF